MSRYIVILTVVMTSLYLTSCNNNSQTFEEVYQDEEYDLVVPYLICHNNHIYCHVGYRDYLYLYFEEEGYDKLTFDRKICNGEYFVVSDKTFDKFSRGEVNLLEHKVLNNQIMSRGPFFGLKIDKDYLDGEYCVIKMSQELLDKDIMIQEQYIAYLFYNYHFLFYQSDEIDEYVLCYPDDIPHVKKLIKSSNKDKKADNHQQFWKCGQQFKQTIVNDVAKDTIDEDAIYGIADEEPEFPGGWTACMEYCRQNMRYPETARELRIEEKIFVRFAVMKDGSIDSVEIIRSAGNQSLEEEAIRIVKTMPKWKPARLRGKVVNCWYTIPVVFKLSEE